MGTLDYLVLIAVGVTAIGATVGAAMTMARAKRRWSRALVPVPVAVAAWYILLPAVQSLFHRETGEGTVDSITYAGLVIGAAAILSLVAMAGEAWFTSRTGPSSRNAAREGTCPRCGESNPANTRHCIICGSSLTAGGQPKVT